MFVAGWRPFIGWVGGFGMAYQFLLYPLLTWVWPILIARGTLPAGTTIPPVLDGDVLFAMVSGLLGIAGMRSFDKMKGTDSKMSRYNLEEVTTMCSDGWNYPRKGEPVDGECPDCGEPTCDGFAAVVCNYSPCACETCGACPCGDGSC